MAGAVTFALRSSTRSRYQLAPLRHAGVRSDIYLWFDGWHRSRDFQNASRWLCVQTHNQGAWSRGLRPRARKWDSQQSGSRDLRPAQPDSVRLVRYELKRCSITEVSSVS
jgi:hypothetical protein